MFDSIFTTINLFLSKNKGGRSQKGNRGSGRRQRGFTLIELLIVIAIILILIAIALPNFLEAQIRAKVASVRSDLRTISTALHSYFIDWQNFPHISEDEYDPEMWGLAQLTTPLTYLNELPTNAFARGSREDQHATYFEMASTGLRPDLLAVGKKKNPFNVHAFAVYSAGPDLNDNFEGERSWPFSGNPNPCVPGSNDMGTISYSAIFWTIIVFMSKMPIKTSNGNRGRIIMNSIITIFKIQIFSHESFHCYI